MFSHVAEAKTADSRWHWLYKIGAAVALTLFALFLLGGIGVLTASPQQAANNGWFTALQDNWLMILFKLNAGFSDVQSDSLAVLNLLDLVIMALFGVMSLALYAALRHTHRLWSLLAVSLPFLGIPVFLITSTAGRSALLVGGLVMSIVMLRSDIFGKVTAYVGVVANALLFFAGDIGTAIFTSSPVIAILIGIGYGLWMIWFVQLARRLIQLGHPESKALPQKS
jgi:hypothetical protein